MIRWSLGQVVGWDPKDVLDLANRLEDGRSVLTPNERGLIRALVRAERDSTLIEMTP